MVYARSVIVSMSAINYNRNVDKKLFCIMEQGALPNRELTLERKGQFAKPYCDLYRVNWYKRGDPNAQWTKKYSLVSESRNFLYQKTRGKYEYYIFSDDDVRFSTPDGDDVAEAIKRNLLDYKPVLAGFYSSSRYRNPVDRAQRVKCGLVHDMDSIVCNASFADICMPIVYHGAGWVQDYMYYLALQLCPEKYHIYLDVEAQNTRYHWLDNDTPSRNGLVEVDVRPNLIGLATPAHKQRMEEYFEFREKCFEDRVFMEERNIFGMWFNENCEPDSAARNITLDEVGTVLNVKHPDFVNRRVSLPYTDRVKQWYLLKALYRGLTDFPHNSLTRRVLRSLFPLNTRIWLLRTYVKFASFFWGRGR